MTQDPTAAGRLSKAPRSACRNVIVKAFPLQFSRFFACFSLILGSVISTTSLLAAEATPACTPPKPYEWPTSLGKIVRLGEEIRLKLLGQQMDEFSSRTGSCYGRDPQGKAEVTWVCSRRDERLETVMKSGNVKAFCKAVKDYLVNEKLRNSRSNPSPYCQYANCGEGQLVGACLAYAYGFPPEKILMCDSAHDHAWTLVPEPGKEGSWCLLDRWNAFRCGVTMKGKQQDYLWTGDVRVPGKRVFKFSNTDCVPLTVHNFEN
jgi:hypothetical protein